MIGFLLKIKNNLDLITPVGFMILVMALLMVPVLLVSVALLRLWFIIPLLMGLVKVLGWSLVALPWISFGWSVFTAPIVILFFGALGLLLSVLSIIILLVILKDLID